MKTELTRKEFLTGVGATVGATGIAAVTAGLAGCSTVKPASAEGAAAADLAAAGVDARKLIPQAYLNPQDYDYRQKTTDFKTLFSPLKIGPLKLNSRMFKSAAGSATSLKGPSDELFQYYVNFAKGGVELIWMENIPWLELNPTAIPKGVSREDIIAFGKRLVAECAKYGAHLGVQWAPMGKPVADLTVEAIQQIEDGAVRAAQSFREMGIEALEINAAGFNQGELFLSRYSNTRTDAYGAGSLENRARFVIETVQKVKKAVGSDFVVQVLIDCIEENDNLSNNATLMWRDDAITQLHNKVTTVEEGIAFAKLFEAAGVDSLHLRLGPLGNHPCQFASDLYFIPYGVEGATGYGTQWDFKRHWQGQLIGNHSGAGMLLDVVRRYKAAVKIPCGTVTYMDPAHAPAFFEKALAEGKADFYLMTRPLTVDTEYVNKLRKGKLDEIAPCTRCLHCHIGGQAMNRAMGYCRVNALTERVMTPKGPATYELPPLSGAPKNVMVIGGGPAGMEAARVAAARGHKVTLYEKGRALGGLLDFAAMIKGPHENLGDFKAYLIRQLAIHGVTVVLNTTVDAALIKAKAPDVVVLAVGALPGEVGVAGNDSVPVLKFESFMDPKLGENVVVYGSNAQAFDCALWLTVRKRNVQIVTPNRNEELDKQQSQHAHRAMTTTLYSLGAKAWPGSTIKSVGKGQVTIATDYGVEVTLPCDAIINAADLKPNKSLIDGLPEGKAFAIGDCSEPYNIALAIRAGNDVGRAI